MNNMNEAVIIISSNEPWGNMHYSKHHYALELAKHTKVFFINPTGSWKLTNTISKKANKIDITPVSSNLNIIDYSIKFPKKKELAEKKVCKELEKLTGNSPIIFWQFDVFRFIDVNFKKKVYRIFHVVDEYKKIPTNFKIANKADLIICVSTNFVKTYDDYSAKKITIRHGVTNVTQNYNESKIQELKNKFGKYLLWCGTFSPRVDYLLLSKIATTYTNLKLLLIGKLPSKIPLDMAEKIDQLRELTNVTILPPQEPESLNNYISASQLCLIAYKTDPDTIGTTISSLKFNQYLAHFKPIISTFLSEYSKHNNKLVLMANSHKDFLVKVESALSCNWLPDENLTKEYIQKYSYNNLIKEIASYIPEPYTFAS